jgi:hypothetical protein
MPLSRQDLTERDAIAHRLICVLIDTFAHFPAPSDR